MTLAWVQELSSEYYLIAPDTPGQPGWSDPHEPDEYGPWVVDVLDGLGIDRAAMVGISHGGGVLLEAAVHAPDRIAAAVLVAPAGFGTPLSSALARIVVLSLAYRVVPRRGLLTRALAPMFSDSIETVDDVVIETVGQALRTGDLQASFPGPDDQADLEPLVDAAGYDDVVAPTELQISLNDGLGDAESARLDIQWSELKMYSFHYVDSDGVNWRFDRHPNTHSPEIHFHRPPEAATTDAEPSCIDVTEVSLVTRAVHTMWRAAYENDELNRLNSTSNPL